MLILVIVSADIPEERDAFDALSDEIDAALIEIPPVRGVQIMTFVEKVFEVRGDA